MLKHPYRFPIALRTLNTMLRYEVSEASMKMDEAVALVDPKLPHKELLEEFLKRLRYTGSFYNSLVRGVEGIQPVAIPESPRPQALPRETPCRQWPWQPYAGRPSPVTEKWPAVTTPAAQAKSWLKSAPEPLAAEL